MKTYDEFVLSYNLHPVIFSALIQSDRLLNTNSLEAYYKSRYKKYKKAGPIRRFFIIRGFW